MGQGIGVGIGEKLGLGQGLEMGKIKAYIIIYLKHVVAA